MTTSIPKQKRKSFSDIFSNTSATIARRSMLLFILPTLKSLVKVANSVGKHFLFPFFRLSDSRENDANVHQSSRALESLKINELFMRIHGVGEKFRARNSCVDFSGKLQLEIRILAPSMLKCKQSLNKWFIQPINSMMILSYSNLKWQIWIFGKYLFPSVSRVSSWSATFAAWRMQTAFSWDMSKRNCRKCIRKSFLPAIRGILYVLAKLCNFVWDSIIVTALNSP